MHTDNDKIWRKKADEIKVDPTTNTWSRVRSKLDGSKKQSSLPWAIMAIAASLLLMLMVWFPFSNTADKYVFSQDRPTNLETLVTIDDQEFINDVRDYREYIEELKKAGLM
jgi:hypothetical protein